MRIIRWQLYAVGLALLGAVATARAERLPLKAYGTADGLPHTRVTCIVPDSRGFLWFCGPEGLSRFDGKGFTTYGVPQGLANTRVNDFLESSRGMFWLATNGGVFRFTPLMHRAVTHDEPPHPRFISFRVGNEAQTNRVNVLYEDRGGRLWAGTDGGVFCLDGATDHATFRRIELGLAARPDPAVQVWSFAEDREGHLLIGTSWGLVRRLPDGRTLHTAVQPAQGTDHVRALLVDSGRRVWIGHDAGLFSVGPGSRVTRYTTEDGISGGTVRALLQSSDGRMWIGTWEGLTQFDGVGFKAFTRAHGISTPMTLAEDRTGNLWIGTLAAGALRLTRTGFRAYAEGDGLANTTIRSVFQTSEGELYAVSAYQRIHRFDGSGFTAVRPNLSRDLADVMNAGAPLRDHAGEWWIPGGAGLYRFAAVGTVEQLKRAPPKAIYTTRDGLAGDDVFTVFEDSRTDIWISRRTPTSLVVTRWERATGRFHRYGDADGLPAFNRATTFAEDRAGNVWIGFQNGGLARYQNGRFMLFTAADGAPGGGVGTLYVDARQRLWVGATRPGLSLIEAEASERPRFVPHSSAHGLSGEGVGCITDDQFGRLYLCRTSGRVDRLDPATGRVRHYTTADGLSGGILTAAYRDRRDPNGGLWFGSYNGLFRLLPELDGEPSPPSVLIATVRVGGESYLSSDLGQSDIARFELEADQNQLQIEFFGLGAGAGEELKYQYRLEGADRDWNPPSDQRQVNYASLSPGRYRFVVRSAAWDGSPGSTPATVAFTILSPIWQRWWFQAGVAVAAILILFAAHRYRVAHLLALERVRMRIAADLHDDIGGSLSRISIQSEVAYREIAGLGEQPARRLTEIAGSARGLVDALGDVVWSVDPRRDDLASVCRRIREYAADLLGSTGVRFTYAAPSGLEKVKLEPQARRQLFLLFKEAVTNVARHACARSVSLDMQLTNRELRAELRDDGRGFDTMAVETGALSDRHGIASMRARAERLGGRLIVESSADAGTTLTLRMPLPGKWERMTMRLSRRMR